MNTVQKVFCKLAFDEIVSTVKLNITSIFEQVHCTNYYFSENFDSKVQSFFQELRKLWCTLPRHPLQVSTNVS